MSKLKSILLSPYHFFVGENGIFGSLGGRHQRYDQGLYLGLPAVVFAIIGMLFLVVGELSAGKPLIERYLADVDELQSEKTNLQAKINQSLKMASGANNIDANAPEVISLFNQLSDLLGSEEILLSKLNSLAPEDPKHLYKLAKTFLARGDLAKYVPVKTPEEQQEQLARSQGFENQGISIMNRIAPLEEPGFLDAHLYLAKYQLRTNATSSRNLKERIYLANSHLDLAIVRDGENTTALGMKTLLAQRSGKPAEAKEFLEKLFLNDPFVYPQLCQANLQLGKGEENLRVLHSARERLSSRLSRMTVSPSKLRTKHVTYLVDCFHRLEDIDAADAVAQKEMTAFPSNEITQGWGKRLLAIGQQLRYQSGGKINAKNATELVGYLRKGYDLDPNNEKILEYIVNLRSFNIPGLTEVSKAIYKPSTKAPASVHNILGTIAMSNGDYLEATKRFTTADSKSPNNAEYLNNLSYAYLTRPDPDPLEALKLVDKAIRSIRPGTTNTRYLTHFYDTKGRSLLALGKIAEDNGNMPLASSHYSAAAGKLLRALVDRPNDVPITQAILECYEANGQPKHAKVWSERLKQLQVDEEQSQAVKEN